MWTCAAYAGLRRGELRALTFDNIDFDANVIHVRNTWDDADGELEGGKSAAAVRDVFLLPELRRELLEHKRRTARIGTALVFGRTASDPFVPSTVNDRARKAWKAAGLEAFTLHELRHCFVSLGVAAGINPHTLMLAAGHASFSMTMDVYGHQLPGALEEAEAAMRAYLTG